MQLGTIHGMPASYFQAREEVIQYILEGLVPDGSESVNIKGSKSPPELKS